MKNQVIVRRAVPEDADRLTAIAHAAKRHWGYSDHLLSLWRSALTVTESFIEANFVYCAVSEAEILGFYAVSQHGTDCELEHMWVAPAHMSRGHGAALFDHATETVRSHGGARLRIASDPNAEGFYVRMGAHRVGEEASTPAGRNLPVLVLELGKKEDSRMTSSALPRSQAWPSLPLEAWSDTCATLHMWTQIVGKIRLTQSPWLNHSWHVTLYVTARGLTTSPIPYGMRIFQIDFDFIGHQIVVQSSDGGTAGFSLEPQSVAAFYRRLMEEMTKLDLRVDIHKQPNEVPDPIAFDKNETQRAYDREYANRFWRVLVQADRVFKAFRARFIGKCSPVHFFWGAPDLAVTRFSGRRAPQHPGGVPHLPDWVTREAYSHEVSSCGFWPGGGPVPHAAFYSYAYPEPAGFSDAPVRPGAAFYSRDLREFVLPYDAVRESDSPDDTLLDFLQATYEAAANSAKWDRGALERRDDSRSPL